MKLSISNLAWPKSEETWCLDIISSYGIKGVEVAPLKLFDSWDDINQKSCDKVKESYFSLGLEISSFQAITFGVNNLALQENLEGQKNFFKHMMLVRDSLQKLGGEIAVFGSPGLRNFKSSNAFELISLFSQIGSLFAEKNVALALEAVPSYYHCNWLNNITSSLEFIEQINSPGLVPHFDTGCQNLSGDIPLILSQPNIFNKFNHFHFSEKDLITFEKPSTYNIDMAKLVKENYFGEWVVLEMLDKQFSKNTFEKSISNFSELLLE